MREKGLRPESTAFAFAYSLEIGADVLEMDTLFTKDGVPVIWHDHRISDTKCRDTATGGENFPYVGKLIHELTLEQVKTLDCGSLQLSAHKQAQLHPGAQIQTLEEVLELVKCYGDDKVEINLETKLDPTAPEETEPMSTYVDKLVPIPKKHSMDKRTYIQSFDWRTLIGIKKKFPETRTVALLDDTTIAYEYQNVTGYPWLGGIDLGDFEGDYIKAAKSIGATILSPVHGHGGSVNTVGYVTFTTKDMVERAHKEGLQVIPWTVDDESTINKLMDDGVDAIISNYPERVKFVGRDRCISAGKKKNHPRPQCLKNAALSV
ncbi:glycerophosphoryl diester phosphodiesterase [Sphaerosporella brunnea]|uniref:Glycerophosphoryl diester phosphodiesterase n=1 Tax=Sphaerosporella brunnea TaxID=1250544 RepID=A0A5J5F8B7_9PEZI|nr:glycerophosphoryl diester phosphodiesterase [Sphaerosporella brunnea]